jgi:hypothetical protein
MARTAMLGSTPTGYGYWHSKPSLSLQNLPRTPENVV